MAAIGILVFARYDSVRLPGKALRAVGGMPLLERVLRRAQTTDWPVYLATTQKGSDDQLAALACRLGVSVFRGSEENVMERAVLAAEAFGLDVFVRICGDRPLFPIDRVRMAVDCMLSPPTRTATGAGPDLVTNWPLPGNPSGLTTEVIRTRTLRGIMEQGADARQREHMTTYFYEHVDEFSVLRLPVDTRQYICPGFAVDTEADLVNLNRIFDVSDHIEITPQDADRIYAQQEQDCVARQSR
jgi:spore coat polysaccharide biosynthesis protein SpsF